MNKKLIECFWERMKQEQLVNPIVLAEELHRDSLWPFDELPEDHRATLVDTARAILKKFFVIPKKKLRQSVAVQVCSICGGRKWERTTVYGCSLCGKQHGARKCVACGHLEVE